MKPTKFILPVLAFVLAIGTAFSSEASFSADAKGFNPDAQACVLGDLQPIPPGKECGYASGTRCQVRILVDVDFEIVPAFFLNGTCTTALYYQ